MNEKEEFSNKISNSNKSATMSLPPVYALVLLITITVVVCTGVTTFLFTKQAYELPIRDYVANTTLDLTSFHRNRRNSPSPCLEAQIQLFNLTNRLTGNDVLTQYIEDMECYYGIKASANNKHLKFCEGTYTEDTFSFLNARIFADISDCRKKNPKALGEYAELIKQSIRSLNLIKDHERKTGNTNYHNLNARIAVGLLTLVKDMEDIRKNMLRRCFKVKNTALQKFPKIFRDYDDKELVKARGKEARQHAKRAFVVYNQIIHIIGTMRNDFWERRQCM